MTASTIYRFDVVGLTFVAGYPENVLRVAEIEEERTVGEGLAVVLLREPFNPAHPNAVGVHVPAVGKVGFVPRDTADVMALELDAGARAVGDLFVRIHPDAPHRPGMTVVAVLTKGTS